jgi:hypothetical protein
VTVNCLCSYTDEISQLLIDTDGVIAATHMHVICSMYSALVLFRCFTFFLSLEHMPSFLREISFELFEIVSILIQVVGFMGGS